MGYSRLEPGRELEVREYISFQRGRDGFCELIECSVDELLERKAESIVREKELCQRMLILVALIKGAERIAKEMFGL